MDYFLVLFRVCGGLIRYSPSFFTHTANQNMDRALCMWRLRNDSCHISNAVQAHQRAGGLVCVVEKHEGVEMPEL